MDSRVVCTVCGREEDVSFGACLSSGWPKCCGYTMRLERTNADIAKTTGDVVDEQLAAPRPAHGMNESTSNLQSERSTP